MNIDFYKMEESKLLSYHYFSAQVSNNDLLELNDFKIRNLLSIVFNIKTKELILEDLFNINGTFLSNETKDNLFKYLSLNERNELKNLLSSYLDFQINSEWYNRVLRVLNSESINIIVTSSLILNNIAILSQLEMLFPRTKFVDWLNYDETKPALILDYNHAWKKRNVITIQNSRGYAYFLNHFFELPYQWKIFNEEKQLFKAINTNTRESLLGKEVLIELKESLLLLKPKNTFNEWDVLHESNHKNSYNAQEEILIYYTPANSNRYRINSAFLLVKDEKFTIKNANDLVINPNDFEEKYHFSNLENIISQIDLNELNKAIEKDQSIDMIIQPLWKKFNLNENDGRLWKQLLSRKVKESGINKIYSDIEEILGVKQFISLNTFENSYCNPENNTIIPREKLVFKAICHYLELPIEYRAAMHRERNLIGGHSQELNIKLKELIKAIVEYGVMDKHTSDDDLLELLNRFIDKIENRVDMDFFGFTKESLLYACIATCYEIINKMRLKPIFKIEYIIPN